MPRISMLAGTVLLAAAGCATFPSLTGETPTEQVASHPFGGEQPRPVQRSRASYAPANTDVAMRVDRVGQELVAANPQAGLRPLFGTIGAPAVEIFHLSTSAVYVTEGLVKQCPTDRELTAVLASELGKMIAEREATASRQARDPDVPAPAPLPIGGHGYGGDADPSMVFEVSKHEASHPRKRVLVQPDPAAVAATLLKKAGHSPADLQAVRPILDAADKNCQLENQLKTSAAPAWRGQ